MVRVVITLNIDLPDITKNHTLNDMSREIEAIGSDWQKRIYTTIQRNGASGFGKLVTGVPNEARLACDWHKP